MNPEEDFDTWKLVVTTVTDDVQSFGEVLPDLERLVYSIVDTNYLPGNLSQYTDDFLEETFPNIVNSLQETASSMTVQNDKMDDVNIVSDFFKLAIKLYTSKLKTNLKKETIKFDEYIQKHIKSTLCSTKMIDMIMKIFGQFNIYRKTNQNEKYININLINYFLNDLDGINKCISVIDDIKNLIDQPKNKIEEESNSNIKINDDFDDLLDKESFKLSQIIKLIQKVNEAKTIEKVAQEGQNDEWYEVEKMIDYYEKTRTLLLKTFPIFQKIAENNLRKFDMSHLDSSFEILTKSYPIYFNVIKKDEIPLVLDLWDSCCSNIISIFLKSQYFDKHIYILKKLSYLCTKIDENYKNNENYFQSNQTNLHLQFFFIDKETLLNVISDNLEQIQNLYYNKEFNELIADIYAFAIENSNDMISIDHIKNFWSQIQFVFAAERTSFFKIFEKIIKEMNPINCNELINDLLIIQKSDSNSSYFLPINISFLDFLYHVSINLKNDPYKASFIQIRNIFWSISFDEFKFAGVENSKEETDIRDFAQKKLINLCKFYSNEMIEKLVKLPLRQNDDKNEFILNLFLNSFNDDTKISDDLCKQIVPLCVSNLENEVSINLLTKIFKTNKIFLEKEQIEKLSNFSNKFLKQILFSSKFSDSDIENILLSSPNINSDLVDLVYEYIYGKNIQWKCKKVDYLTCLPFEKEDLLWKFSLIHSDVQKKFIKMLCEIYSNNDGNLLTDKEMINNFLNKIEEEINKEENIDSCLQLLKKFIKTVDKTNPKISYINKHEKSKDVIITVIFEGVNEKFYFSKDNIALVIYYEASKILNVPISKITLIHSASQIPIKQKLKNFLCIKNNVKIIPTIKEHSFIEYNHLRTVSPKIIICNSNLMNKLVSLMLDNKKSNNNNNHILMSILNDLPTFEPLYEMINHFNIMKEINFEKIFPIDYPKFFLYNLHSLKIIDDTLKNDFVREKGIEYFINAITKTNSSNLIKEIIDFMENILSSSELIEKYSDQMFDALLRVSLFIPDFNHENCLKLIKRLKPSIFPHIDPEFSFKLIDPIKKTETKNNMIEENNFDRFYPQFLERAMLNEEIAYDLMMIEEQKMFYQINKKDNKEVIDDNVHISTDIPFSHLIVLSIAVYIIQKNICLNSSLELNTEKLTFAKKIVKEAFSKLPIPSEYFESCFVFLNSSNYKNFLDIFLPHSIPITDKFLQFIIDNLDINSKYLIFIVEFLQINIDKIESNEKRTIIFDFIFKNFFTLERDSTIEDDIFKNSLMIASNAPSEKIINEIAKIGIPEFEKYNINGNSIDFKPTSYPTGLKNLGSTCYFNSILQQFYHCLSLRKALIEYKGDNQLLKELGFLFSQMKNGSLKSISPQNVVDNWICWDGEKMNPKIQQDVAEFTIMMIDKLSPIIPNSMFNGKLLFKIEGINNDEGRFFSERNEPFSVLILPINQSNTIEDCLKSFNLPSYFTNKNQYYSDTLQRKIDAKQSDFIQELPDHLILQLKRFEYDYFAGTRKKINSKVMISEEIDISSICDFKDSINNNSNTKYKLTGVIQHMGSAIGGHYYSYVMDRDTKEWFKFNDASVTPTTIDEVIENSNGYDSNAYILFYDKINLNEIDDSSIDKKSYDDLQNEKKMNSSYQFYITSAFTDFLNQISKRKELHEITLKLILRIIPHENFVISENYFQILKDRLNDDVSFAINGQNEITSFKFLILNECKATNYNIVENILDPMLSKKVSQKLIKLAIDLFDYVNENLPNSFYYFRVLYTIVETVIREKNELLKDEENNNDSIKILNEQLDIISKKTTYIIKYGINEYIAKHDKLSRHYIIHSICLSAIVRLYNIFETIPNDYVEILKNNDFLKTFYSSSNVYVSCLMKNYIRARTMKLFDVDSMLKSFFIKESLNINSEDLVDSLFFVFEKEAFKFAPLLKFRMPDDCLNPQEIMYIYPFSSKNEQIKLFLFQNCDLWLPNIFLHDARLTGNSKRFFDDLLSIENPFNSINLFDFNSEDIEKLKEIFLNMIHCLLGCFKELKDLIMKDDFSKNLSFPKNRYKALPLLIFLKEIIKLYKFHFENENITFDLTEMIEFGEFLLSTGHSHPFDHHIISILQIAKNDCTEKLLYDSIPDKDIMMLPEKLRKLSHEQFEQYILILTQIIEEKTKMNTIFSDDFYFKLYTMIIFNFQNLLSITSSANLYNSIDSILKLICDKDKNSSKSFIDYLDNNFEFCILNGFVSLVSGLKYLKIKRPFAKYIQSKSFYIMIENSLNIIPNFVYDIIITNEDDNTLFEDISIVALFLCNTTNNENKSIVWNYLLNNVEMRIVRCDNENKLNLQRNLFTQFNNKYNYNFIDSIDDFHQKQKEIESISKFVIQCIPQSENNHFMNLITDLLILLSKKSPNILNDVFDILIQKVPERIKDMNFVSDVLSNKIFSKFWAIIEKLCQYSFEGKETKEIVSTLKNSRFINILIQELNILNFIYEGGIIENEFKLEDEEQLSSVIVPFRLIMKYKKLYELIISDEEKHIIIKESSSLLNKLTDCGIDIQIKEEVIEVISKYIS